MDPHFRLLKAIKTGLLILLTAQMCLAGFPLVQSQDFAIPSDSSGVSWTDSILRGIREAFTRGGDHFSMVAESLDARRASDPGRANRIPEFLFVQHPESFYQKYRHFVWATLAVVLVLSASVVVLSIAIVRRRRAEEALQDSEQKFRTLFDDAKDAIFIHDLDGHILDMNREACVRLGYTRDEFLKMTPADVDIPEEAENVPARLGILRRQGYSLFETTHRQRDGSVYPVEVSSARFEHGGKTLVCSVCRDITERKRAEETLRQTNLVVENSPAMLFRWKAAEGWPVAFVSENVIQIGYSSEEFLNGSIPFASIIHPEDLERVGREVQTYSAKGVERFQQEYRIITKDGQIRWVDDRTVVERNAEGRITHYQGILVDITERKQAENLASARHRFSMRLASSTSLDEALSSCFDMILSISGMDSGGVYRVRSETSDLDLIFSKGLSESFVEAAKHLRVDSPQARIILAGNPVYSTYTALGVPLSSLRRKEGLRAIAIVPITYQGRVIACYNIASHTLDNIPEYVRELVEAVVLELGNAIARILAEESLRESEERLRTIGNNLPGVMIYQAVVKPDGSRRFSYVSVGVERLHGYTADQILADSSLFYSQVYEEDIERMLQQELLAIHELEPFDVEVRFRTRSGQVFWRRIVSQLRRLANGEVMSNGIELDITERKRAEEALRASETFLETIIEQSPHSMWVSDHRGTLLRMNQACRDLLHATDEELVGKYNVLEDNVVEEQGAMPLVKRVFEQGEQVRFTLRYDSARLQSPLLGETAQLLLEVTISPVLDAHRRVVHAIIQHLDITERERAQAALRES
jgi:PAS domain S-box-containing protein